MDNTPQRIEDLMGSNAHYKSINQNLTMNISKLRARAYIMESLALAIPQSVWMIDESGNILFVNDTFFEEVAQYTQMQSADIIGRNFYDLLYQFGLSRYEIDAIKKQDASVFADKIEKHDEQNMTLLGRTCVYYTYKKIIIDPTHQLPALIGLATDITPLKQQEALLKASVTMVEKAHLEKIRFLENIRHDLHSPLSNIVAAADIIKKMLPDEGAQEFLEAIISSGNHVMELFSQLIDFFQTKNQKQPNRIQSIVLRQLINDVTSSMRMYAHNRPIAFQTTIDSNVPDVILTDRVKVSRILNNLLNNAFKYTHQGYVSLNITYDEHSEHLWVEIGDSGIGIAKEDIDRIFEPLVRLHQPGNGDYEGLGLGLSIVDQFVRDLNGRIQVESDLDKGTIFKLCIPASFVRETEGSHALRD